MEKLTQGYLKFVDATPDEGYPLRILRAYREDCDCMFSDNTVGEEPTSPLLKLMNEHNRQRAVILDKAIVLLEKGSR